MLYLHKANKLFFEPSSNQTQKWINNVENISCDLNLQNVTYSTFDKAAFLNIPAHKKSNQEISCHTKCFLKICSGNLQILYDSRNKRCYATLNLITISWDMWHPFSSDLTIFNFPTSFLINFTTKSYLHSETLHTVPPNNYFIEGNIYLCVKKVIRVLDLLFHHINSWCRSTLCENDFQRRISHKTFCT